MIAVLALLAHAQTSPAAPETNVQTWRIPVDADQTLWTPDTMIRPSKTVTVRGVFSYMRDPLVYEWENGDVSHDFSDAVALDVVGGLTLGRLRIGAWAPVWLYTTGDAIGGGAGLGDIALEARGVALDREEMPIGLALSGRVDLPTATVDAPVGNKGVAWEIDAITDVPVGPATLSVNVGTRGAPPAEFDDDFTIADRFLARVGLGIPFTDNAGLSLDAGGDVAYATTDVAGVPFQGIVGAWGRPKGGDTVIRGGFGFPITQGVGVPVARLIFAVGYEPKAARDTDLDGIVDKDDGCITVPEDKDGWKDEDGCPEDTELRIRAVDASGADVPGGTVTREGATRDINGTYVVSLPAGPFSATLDAPKFQPKDVNLEIHDGPPMEITQILQPDPVAGTLELVVLDPSGARADDFTLQVDGQQKGIANGEAKVTELAAGVHQVRIESGKYATLAFPAEIVAGETNHLEVRVQLKKVTVTREKLVITDKIYFDTDKATIKPESFPLLEEIAGVLKDRPDILAISIEGHTDSRGSSSYNLKLSDDRTKSVRDWLVEHGVAADRLTAVGFGESRPVDKHQNEAAWELNRRVEFVITRWAEGTK